MTADEALARVWDLAAEDLTDEVIDEHERLLPAFVEAGYAETLGDTWRLTPKGSNRLDELGLVDNESDSSS